MLGIAAYADKLSVAPGERLRVMVHAEPGIARYEASIVRIVCGDRNPDGPGFKTVARPSAIDGTYPARQQRTDAGSYLRLPLGGRAPAGTRFGAAILAWPTLCDRPFQTLLARCADDHRAGWALGLDSGRHLVLRLADAVVLRSAATVPLRRWTRLAVRVAADAVHLHVGDAVTTHPVPSWPAADVDLLVAGTPGPDGVHEHFNGKLERPLLFDDGVAAGDLAGPHPALRGLWDFAEGIATTRIHDRGPHGLHGEAVNLPTRAVTGSTWDGSEMNWTRAPAQYAAIHFHDDDLYDAGWRADIEWTVPADWPSALYAIRLAAGEHVDHVPVVVRPAKPGASAPVALLLPTASYMAYANDRCALHGNNPEVLATRLVALAPGDVFLAAHPEFGLSLYDTHRDGSGVVYSSRLRPVPNMRPGHVAWQGGLGSGLWNFNADTHITDWLEASGQTFEVITDEDLERDGQTLLDAYRVVITGTHPEYTSPRMHQAIAGYVAGGGRLMYLGGNGFYWRIAFNPERPGVIEVRRAEDGNRSWACEPGEYYQSFDGGYGGLWRRNGRPPQSLVGVGYSCQGFNVSVPYRRLPASFDPRAAWIFEGVAADAAIGDKGLNGGGAAGIECDRADALLGTPEDTLVVATADRFPDSYIVTNEDVLVNRPTILGDLNPMIRADMVFFANPRGGAVFSTGSIAWSGALAPDRYGNAVARITANVLRRFLDPGGIPPKATQED